MCEMTSIGEISAARTTIPLGSEEVVFAGRFVGDLRRAFTTSLTPRFRVRCAAAVDWVLAWSAPIA